MKPDKYKKVKSLLHPAVNLPEDFFESSVDGGNICVFMLSCLGQDKLLYLDDSFQSLSGYRPEKIKEGGMDFWFSLVHPGDREQMSEKIVASHRVLAEQGFDEAAATPLVLTYRIKHAGGQWRWIRDTKFLVSLNEKIIDKVLGKFEAIEYPSVTEPGLKKKLEEEESCTQLLEFALIHQNDAQKQVLNRPTVQKTTASLTRREKEILQLIAEGLSTKLIADKCNISIHTVETHRRHLLEKLRVKNSMELIKEASRIYWL